MILAGMRRFGGAQRLSWNGHAGATSLRELAGLRLPQPEESSS
jgi:hypothetical protein